MGLLDLKILGNVSLDATNYFPNKENRFYQAIIYKKMLRTSGIFFLFIFEVGAVEAYAFQSDLSYEYSDHTPATNQI